MVTTGCKMSMKRVSLILLSATLGLGIVLDSNEYFDRILTPNFGEEITFYGLTLNFSEPLNFSQRIVKSIIECKTYFRVVPSYTSTFANKQDNGTVLCTSFLQPVFTLPTLMGNKSVDFAFNKELSSYWKGGQLVLLSNGKFYWKGSGSTNATKNNQTCKSNFPNGGLLRFKSKKEYNIVYNKFRTLNDYIILDLACVTANGQPYLVWGDGTEYLKTEVASIFKLAGDLCTSDLLAVNVPAITIYGYTGSIYTIFCELNSFLT